MSGWLRYLQLTAKSKTGVSSSVIVWGVLALLFAAVTFGFLVFAAFIYLADRYDPLTAALVLGGFFLLFTIIALICCLLCQRRTVERAKLALAERSQSPWLDPKMLGIGLQVGRAVGWRKLVPLAAAAILAVGLTREWFGNGGARADDGESGDES